jgi:hypothetical protein
MNTTRIAFLCAGAIAGAVPLAVRTAPAASAGIVVRLESPTPADGLDGRLLLLISKDDQREPRFQVTGTSLSSAQVFGIDVEGMKTGEERTFDPSVLGYPIESLDGLPPGDYTVQALLHKYETFHLADGHVLKLPPDRGEGQQWNRAPGNLYSAPLKVHWSGDRAEAIRLNVDRVIPELPAPSDTKYVKHVRIRSELLSTFWGRDMFLGAHVLLPEGFDTHPAARYPLVINHGHFSSDLEGWRETPPDPNLKCEYSERFHLECYNRVEEQAAYDLYKEWTGPSFPRVLVVEIQHANPYYDDSYAVNSANLGPYGDAIMTELIPYIESRFRGIGAGWARAAYGGSTGGWEALAAQVFYPDAFNAAYAACPDPIDFRAYTQVNLYEDANAYWSQGPFMKVPRPGHRNYLGQISTTLEQMNRLELVLGTRTRSGQQWDIWEAVFSPQGADGYPARIWDKRTGVIDRSVAEYWRDHYDLMWIIKRDWNRGLGAKVAGKIHLYVGDMDNYYLNNAVYLAEDVLNDLRDPAYGGEVAYGDRAEHCWNGDPTRANAYSRLRYHQMFIPRFVERAVKTAPAGADVRSWRY